MGRGLNAGHLLPPPQSAVWGHPGRAVLFLPGLPHGVLPFLHPQRLAKIHQQLEADRAVSDRFLDVPRDVESITKEEVGALGDIEAVVEDVGYVPRIVCGMIHDEDFLPKSTLCGLAPSSICTENQGHLKSETHHHV